MKLNLMMVLAAALVLAPAYTTFAADEPAAEKVKAKPKKKMAKKPLYTKFAEAMAVAENNDEPVLVLFAVDNAGGKKSPAEKKSDASKILEKELFRTPQFAQDYAKSNLVLLKMKLKTDKQGEAIDGKSSLKTAEERRFVDTHGLNPEAAKKAKQNNKKLKPLDIDNYPAVICIKGNLDKQEVLFRLPPYRSDDGFGPWLAALDGLLRGKKIEPVVSPKVQKILDDPTAFGGKKRR